MFLLLLSYLFEALDNSHGLGRILSYFVCCNWLLGSWMIIFYASGYISTSFRSILALAFDGQSTKVDSSNVITLVVHVQGPLGQNGVLLVQVSVSHDHRITDDFCHWKVVVSMTLHVIQYLSTRFRDVFTFSIRKPSIYMYATIWFRVVAIIQHLFSHRGLFLL